MPYNPGVTYDPSPLYKGLATFGAGMAQHFQNAEKRREETSFYDQQLMDLSRFTAPGTQEPLVNPEQLDKLLQGNVGGKKAAVADALFKYQQGLGNREFDEGVRRFDTTAGQRDRHFDEQLGEGRRQFNIGRRDAAPRLTTVGGQSYLTVPKTGYVKSAEPSTLPPEPNTPWTEHKSPDGSVVAKSRWNPYTKKTETLNMRESADPFGALMANGGAGGGSATQPAGPKAANPPAPAASAPSSGGAAVRKVTTKAEFDPLPPGSVYTGRDGKQYRKP